MDKKERKPGSGRKPIQDRGMVKQGISLYIESKVIDALGGKAKVSVALHDFLRTVYDQMQANEKNRSNFSPNPDSYIS